jgi:hypothetical protein
MAVMHIVMKALSRRTVPDVTVGLVNVVTTYSLRDRFLKEHETSVGRPYGFTRNTGRSRNSMLSTPQT